MKNRLAALFIVLLLFLLGCTSESAVATPTLAPPEASEALTEAVAPTDTLRPAASATEPEAAPSRRASNTPRPTDSPSRTPRATTQAPTTRPSITPTAACVPRTDWFSYTIRAGDTLGRIALAANTTVAALQAANCIVNVNSIITGQRLVVPVQNLVLPTATHTPSATPLPSDTPTDTETAIPPCIVESSLPQYTITLDDTNEGGTGNTLINWIVLKLGVTRQRFLDANCMTDAEAANVGLGTTFYMPGDFNRNEFGFVPQMTATDSD